MAPSGRVRVALLAAFHTVAVCTCAMAQTILNVDASRDCTGFLRYQDVPLDAGVYRLEPVTPNDGGLFWAFNPADGRTSYCDGQGHQCYEGWLWELVYQVGLDWPNMLFSGPCNQCETPQLAFNCLPPGTRADFTMPFPQTLRLGIQTYCYHAVGGVSVRLVTRLGFQSLTPEFVTCPDGVAICNAQAVGESPVSYAWQWQGASGVWNDLVEGSNSDEGGAIRFIAVGVGDASVQVSRAPVETGSLGVIGALRCTIANGAGVITSSPIPLTVCIADFNCSGGTPDDADVAAFFDAWNNGDASADFNASGGTPDDADVDEFFTRWNAGC
ncbi:MAG: hypothetical protein HUU18_07965 [Phycisphaerales bacterium]|nr:hypothetical protein [Phycisphaerales bacterium]